MHTENAIVIHAPASRIYQLGARIEFWPEILPHYRWVAILRDEGRWRLAEMAATRDGFPVKWTSIQELDPARHRMRFRHVRGISRGMEVEWSIEPAREGGMLVRILHDFDPPWPRPLGPLVARHIVCDAFVHNIAGKTLLRLKSLAEGDQPSVISSQPSALSRQLDDAGKTLGESADGSRQQAEATLKTAPRAGFHRSMAANVTNVGAPTERHKPVIASPLVLTSQQLMAES